MTIRKFTLVILSMLLCISVQAQNGAYERYIQQYSGMAIDQMKRYGIPASITLAQGLLESAAGQSRLAKEANNHFGIKVSGGDDESVKAAMAELHAKGAKNVLLTLGGADASALFPRRMRTTRNTQTLRRS